VRFAPETHDFSFHPVGNTDARGASGAVAGPGALIGTGAAGRMALRAVFAAGCFAVDRLAILRRAAFFLGARLRRLAFGFFL
jgi:hypothetical protein